MKLLEFEVAVPPEVGYVAGNTTIWAQAMFAGHHCAQGFISIGKSVHSTTILSKACLGVGGTLRVVGGSSMLVCSAVSKICPPGMGVVLTSGGKAICIAGEHLSNVGEKGAFVPTP